MIRPGINISVGQPMMGMGVPTIGMSVPVQPMSVSMAPVQPVMLGPPPMYKQISVGPGIDMNEYNRIVQSATSVYQMKQYPLSQNTCNNIKAMLGGDWLCLCYPVGTQTDFSMTRLREADYMVFQLDNTVFQVCRC